MSNGTHNNVELVSVCGESLQAVRTGGCGWVALKSACDALGIDHSGQMQRLKSAQWATMGVIPTVGLDGKLREMTCLRSDKVAMWLATIDTSRLANDEARAKLVRWQCEAADVLDKWARGEQDRPVTMADLQRVLAELGHGKQPGPDVMHHIESLAAVQRKMGEVIVDIRRELPKMLLAGRGYTASDEEVASSLVEMAEKAGLSRSSFYRVLEEHPDLRTKCQRGRGWLIDATLTELARLGKVRRRAEGRITESEFARCIAEAPGEVLTQQQLEGLSEQDPSLPWQACKCRVGGTIDRAVLSAMATYGSLAGLATIAAAIGANERTAARAVRRLQKTGALLVDGTEPGQERRYHILQRVVLTHHESCSRRLAS